MVPVPIDSIKMLLQLLPSQFTKVVQQTFEAVRAQDLLALGESPFAECDWLQACRLPGETRSAEGDGRLVQALLGWVVDRLRPSGEPDHTIVGFHIRWRNDIAVATRYNNYFCAGLPPFATPYSSRRLCSSLVKWPTQHKPKQSWSPTKTLTPWASRSTP